MSMVHSGRTSVKIGQSVDAGESCPIRILLADDHLVFREGLYEILMGLRGMLVVGEACNASSTLALARSTAADILLLDLSMPGRSGIELIRNVRDEAPALKILVLTMHEERQFAMRAFMAGAQGYLTKCCAAQELSDALRKVSAGGSYVGPWMADFLAQNLTAPRGVAVHQQLNDREFDIFMRLARGQTAADIGEALSLSPKTISNYKARIFQTMRFSCDVALVRYAMHHQLIDDHDVM